MSLTSSTSCIRCELCTTQSSQGPGLWIWWLLIHLLWPESFTDSSVWNHQMREEMCRWLGRGVAHLHPHAIGQSSLSWPHRSARIAGKCSLSMRPGGKGAGDQREVWTNIARLTFFSILFLLQETSWHYHKKGCSETYGPDGKPGPWIHHV